MRYSLYCLVPAGFLLSVGVVQAKPPSCDGTSVRIEGEINNNAINPVSFTPMGSVTLGVARMKLFAGGDRENLTCTLLGEPTGKDGVGEQTYDHIITCDDPAQSELSFKTTLTGWQEVGDTYFPDLLPSKTAEEFCRPFSQNGLAIIAFTEEAVANENRLRKGIFSDATGSIDVAGCVNVVNGLYEINMEVEGKLCLTNW